MEAPFIYGSSCLWCCSLRSIPEQHVNRTAAVLYTDGIQFACTTTDWTLRLNPCESFSEDGNITVRQHRPGDKKAKATAKLPSIAGTVTVVRYKIWSPSANLHSIVRGAGDSGPCHTMRNYTIQSHIFAVGNFHDCTLVLPHHALQIP